MAVFTAMQASRLRTAQRLHQMRDMLHECRSEHALRGGGIEAIEDLDERVTRLLNRLIPNQAIEPIPGE